MAVQDDLIADAARGFEAEYQRSGSGKIGFGYIRIFVDLRAPLSLPAAARFLAELNGVVQDLAGPRSAVHVVRLQTGSLELIVAIAALGVSVGQLVVALRDRIAKDPLMVTVATYLSGKEHPIPSITITGGGEEACVPSLEFRDTNRLDWSFRTPRPKRGFGTQMSDALVLAHLHTWEGITIGRIEVRDDPDLIQLVDVRLGRTENPLTRGRWVLRGVICEPEGRTRYFRVHGAYRAPDIPTPHLR